MLPSRYMRPIRTKLFLDTLFSQLHDAYRARFRTQFTRHHISRILKVENLPCKSFFLTVKYFGVWWRRGKIKEILGGWQLVNSFFRKDKIWFVLDSRNLCSEVERAVWRIWLFAWVIARPRDGGGETGASLFDFWLISRKISFNSL